MTVVEQPLTEDTKEHTLSISLVLDDKNPISHSEFIKLDIAARLALDYYLEKLKKLN